ncbi:hypothetical protein RRG08_056080 [Elysia crispata]|uniref:Uncharacterized protein n=1 Tax=Elysia crispata TaxID=231223 RepID=A0AAE0ZCY1_9GAST|nr:hypothetical protein RRG08_056080 [Elysia crispata]
MGKKSEAAPAKTEEEEQPARAIWHTELSQGQARAPAAHTTGTADCLLRRHSRWARKWAEINLGDEDFIDVRRLARAAARVWG